MRDISPSQQYIAILELIPRQPDGITVKELISKLDDLYPTVLPRNNLEEKAEVRRIQRVLIKLSEMYSIAANEGKPQSWYWLSSAPTVMFPAMDLNIALIFSLARKYLEPIIPEKTNRELIRMFSRAEDSFIGSSLGNISTKAKRSWRDKVAIAASGIPRVIPRINKKVETIVYEALLSDVPIRIQYQAWNKKESKEYVVSPNGLFVRGQLIYLVVCFHSHEGIGHLLLHRIKTAEFSDSKFLKIPDFKAQQYVEDGKSHFMLDPSKKKLSLHLKLDDQPLPAVTESPLSNDQRIMECEKGWYSLKATVDNTLELRQWLRSHAHHIEVIGPACLREEFENSVKDLLKLYMK